MNIMNFVDPFRVQIVMTIKTILRFWLLTAIPVALPISLSGATPIQVGHVKVELIPDRNGISPSDTLTLGVLLTPDPEWHLYWTNPGDAGLAPSIDWTLPDGFFAMDPKFPLPERITAGPLASFGFSEELLILTDIVVPKDLGKDRTVTIKADISWLVCKSECIPGETQLKSEFAILPPGDPLRKMNPKRFDTVQLDWPIADSSWTVAASINSMTLRVEVTRKGDAPPSLPDRLYFYPDQKGFIDNAAVQQLERLDNGFALSIPRNRMNTDTLRNISGLLVAPANWVRDGTARGLKFTAPVALIDDPPPADFAITDVAWWQAIVFAFIGGLILNLMPCVLPVLSIKVLAFVQQANNSRMEVAAHNVLFTFGALITFWILAVALILFRASGQQLGWGFQLQSPEFLIVLITFIFVIGLNLLGVFEIGGIFSAVNTASKHSGKVGAFLMGATATIVATPCTAPFMGTALGFALTQPPLMTLAIFTSLGLGMAAPFVVLTSSPWLLRYLPKPGRWMETLRHIMGFLLLGSIVWLGWVFSIQVSSMATLLLFATLLTTGIAAWVIGRWGSIAHERPIRLTARLAALTIIGLSLFIAVANIGQPSAPQQLNAVTNVAEWEPFSPERVVEIQKLGKPILIDFTAAWCLSCQVNEMVALNTAEVQNRLSQLDVVTMKADWTTKDHTITQALARFGRNSVPLYVLYTGKDGEQPILLPEILTPGIVLEALNKIEG